MKCCFCGHMESRVLDSRQTDEGTTIRRRRECTKCGKRFTTYETVDEIPLMVIKKDGRRELFDKKKILSGLLKACEKRPISAKELERLAEEVEIEMRNRLEAEVSSTDIGEAVMERLRLIDDIAYVRFASVYRQFKDITKFIQELEKLLNEK